jgi:hypothetical protein
LITATRKYLRIYREQRLGININREGVQRQKKMGNSGQEGGRYGTQQNSTYPDAGYPDRLGPSGKFVENSTKLICLEITGYRIKYSTVLRLLERLNAILPSTPGFSVWSFFPSGFSTKTLHTPLLPPYVLHAPLTSFFSIDRQDWV